MKNFELENAHPEHVVRHINKIAAVLEAAGGYRFSISTKGLSSVLYLEGEPLTDEEVIKEIILLGDDDTRLSITFNGDENSITVSPKSLN
jgi:hypothetical protein